MEMMAIAETVEDIIAIEDKLSDIRYRIDSLQTSLNNWDRRVSYSTLHLSLEEVREYTTDEKKISYGQELWNAFTDAIEGVGEFEARMELRDGVLRKINLAGDFFLVGDLDGSLLAPLSGVSFTPEAVAERLADIEVGNIIMNLSKQQFINFLFE